MNNAVTDVAGVRVGHAEDQDAATGCTVLLFDSPVVGGVDVRGGAPGTRELACLDPTNLVSEIHAIYLAGGSAFGLDGAAGVMRYLEEHGIGFDVGVARVPIVPGAVLFDLVVGRADVRPTPEMAYTACTVATSGPVTRGNVGAGCGCSIGKGAGPERSMKSGLGTAAVREGDLVVGAIVAVNAFGDVLDPNTGELIAGALDKSGSTLVDSRSVMGCVSIFPGNTTIGAIVTNARLTKGEATRVAMMAHDGYARTIRPVHTLVDGDTVIAAGTGAVRANVSIVGAFAADAMAAAVINAVNAAKPSHGLPSWSSLFA